jgi:uncharacterized protein (TIGR03437 family)
MRLAYLWWTAALVCVAASGQVSGNQSLNEKYYFRHLVLSADASANVTDVRCGAGTITFDGKGTYTATGILLVNATTAPLNASGVYAVNPGGFVTLDNPVKTGTINARLGATGLTGSSTEAGGIFDLFIAIAAPTQPVSLSILSGSYWISTFELQGGGLANLRSANFKLTANNAGSFSESSVTGQARNLGDLLLTQAVSPMTYSVTSDAQGTLTFPLTGGLDQTTQLISGTKEIFISPDGSFFVGGSNDIGGEGMMIGVKTFTSGAAWNGFFQAAGLRYDIPSGSTPARLTSTVGAVNATGAGTVWARRTRQSDGLFDASTLITYALGADGSGNWTSATGRVSVASTGQTFATTGIATARSNTYELYFGSQLIPQSGTGVFLNPQGVLNAASFAPPGYPISPGGFVTLFGTGLGTQTTSASAFPFPTTLGNIQVSINGTAAPVYSVTPTQISAVVPYGVTGSTANIVVTVNQTKSNAVSVPLSPTSPGIFSIPKSGLGDGAILHADGSLVSQANPALAGETVEVFLTGLGAVNPAVGDGAAAPGREPLARVIAPLNVYVGGLLASNIQYKGLAPGLAALYQLNVQIPATVGPGPQSLAVQTNDAFTDMVNLWIGAPL